MPCWSDLMRQVAAVLTRPARPAGWPLVAAMLVTTIAASNPGSAAAPEQNLGDIVDAGAKLMSAAEFKNELVQRRVVGPTATGGMIELIYTPNGVVMGTGTAPG